jgi:hypothetical protein
MRCHTAPRHWLGVLGPMVASNLGPNYSVPSGNGCETFMEHHIGTYTALIRLPLHPASQLTV